VILYDDMVDTAGSLCGAAKALTEIGKCKDIYACATHGVLSGSAIDKINNSYIKELIFTDTIPYPGKTASSKIRYLSSAPLFAEAIERVYEEVSISTLFR
jgi:ribose-phosphate pyrophosphokinase